MEKAAEQGVSDFLLTPSMFGFNALQANLEIWRRLTDSMRENIRAQQDAMLRMMQVRTEATSEAAEDAAEATGDAINGATSFLTPMVAARRAYVQMSGAMIDAQREALNAFVSSARPH
jgi:hypothetical protein